MTHLLRCFYPVSVVAVLLLATSFSTSVARASSPNIDKVSPSRGCAGTLITITGKDFTERDRAVIGEARLEMVQVRTNRILARVPRGAQSGLIGVQRDGSVIWSTRSFTVTALRPIISDVTPSKGKPGTTVRIRGRNLRLATTVSMARQSLRIVSSTGRYIDVVVRGYQSGRFTLRGKGAWRVSSPRAFRVILPPPLPKEASPKTGPPGTEVSVVGSRFTPLDKVFLGKYPLNTRFVSGKKLVATVGVISASGRLALRRRGQSFRVPEADFRVRHFPPGIRSVVPKEAAAGTTITIRGANFVPGVAVLLAGRRLPIKRMKLPKTLWVTVPADAKTGHIVVVTSGGNARSGVPLTIR